MSIIADRELTPALAQVQTLLKPYQSYEVRMPLDGLKHLFNELSQTMTPDQIVDQALLPVPPYATYSLLARVVATEDPAKLEAVIDGLILAGDHEGKAFTRMIGKVKETGLVMAHRWDEELEFKLHPKLIHLLAETNQVSEDVIIKGALTRATQAHARNATARAQPAAPTVPHG